MRLSYMLVLGLVLAFYPGVNIFLTLTIGFILAIPLVLAYAMASTIMKRSGGDYIFISRTIHPAIGFQPPKVRTAVAGATDTM